MSLEYRLSPEDEDDDFDYEDEHVELESDKKEYDEDDEDEDKDAVVGGRAGSSGSLPSTGEHAKPEGAPSEERQDKEPAGGKKRAPRKAAAKEPSPART